MVSMTAWQSFPAQKPGPTPMTSGASVIAVPRFFFAKIASTTTSGRSHARQAALGSASTGICPAERMRRTSSSVSARSAVTSST